MARLPGLYVLKALVGVIVYFPPGGRFTKVNLPSLSVLMKAVRAPETFMIALPATPAAVVTSPDMVNDGGRGPGTSGVLLGIGCQLIEPKPQQVSFVAITTGCAPSKSSTCTSVP